MRDLKLPLKSKWFRMTQSEIKTEEYREINAYWCTRLCLWKGIKWNQAEWNDKIENYFDRYSEYLTFQKFNTTTLTLGYPSKENKDKHITFEQLSIEIGYGREEWGAEKGKKYFVIKHGNKM